MLPISDTLENTKPKLVYKKIYDNQKRISMDGLFENYKLHTGKKYTYDNNGLLLRIELYKNGNYIGDGLIEKF